LAHEGGQVVSPMNTLSLSPRKYSWSQFFYGLSWPLGRSVACQIMSMKNFTYTFGNRTHNLLVAQSERSAPLCAPQFMIMLIELIALLCLGVKSFCKILLGMNYAKNICFKYLTFLLHWK
jgi:hypothetical protein